MSAPDAMLNLLLKHGVEMKPQRNGSYKGSSPFARDSDPSFFINLTPEGWRWYCHSTRQGGGDVKLTMALENISGAEAMRSLGRPMEQRSVINAMIPPEHPKQTAFIPDPQGNLWLDNHGIVGDFLIRHQLDSPRVAHYLQQHNTSLGSDPGKPSVQLFLYRDMHGRFCQAKAQEYEVRADDRMLGGYTIKRTKRILRLEKQHGVDYTPPMLYRLMHTAGASTVYVVESEKTAELWAMKMRDLHVVATGGASNLDNLRIMLRPIKGKRVVLLPDMDKREAWSEDAHNLATYYGHDCTVGEWWHTHESQLGDKDDVGDLLQMLTCPECWDTFRNIGK